MSFLKNPTRLDVLTAFIFTVLITLHPFYLHGKINLFELGIYLPGINALLDGLVPYRDFFHLRGSLELYIPAFFMRIFGEHLGVLSAYFYVGTIITLIIGLLIAKDLFKTRLIFCLFVPVFIARTFPRVAFTFWGGIRYGFGLLAIFLIIFAFKRRRSVWCVFSGIISVLALLTSVEIGVCSIASIFATFIFAICFSLYSKKEIPRLIVSYIQGLAIVLIPYGMYLFWTGSIVSYFDSVCSVINIMKNVFPDTSFSDHPNGFLESLLAMNPFSRHFKHLTPVYCYLFFLGYLILRIKRKKLNYSDLPIVLVAIYGFMMYVLAFRKLGAMQFEMALQPEKLLLFFLLERTFFFINEKKNALETTMSSIKNKKDRIFCCSKIYGINFLIFSLIMSSLGYSIARYNHRFFAYKYVKNLITRRGTEQLIPLSDQKSEQLNLPRVSGMVVPSWQAQDINQLTEFIQSNTKPNDPVFMFPELGSYSFIVDRPFIGRFPMATFSWFGNWHEELYQDLAKAEPSIAVVSKDPGPFFEKVYFQVQQNKKSYDRITAYIEDKYDLVGTTPSLLIYRVKVDG